MLSGEFSQSSCSVVSDSLWRHRLQHARLPCPSPTPGVYSNSCQLSGWCHPIVSSIGPCSAHLQSFPASGSLQMNPSGGQGIGVSASASVLPMNIQDWFPLGCTGCFIAKEEKKNCLLMVFLGHLAWDTMEKQLETFKLCLLNATTTSWRVKIW